MEEQSNEAGTQNECDDFSDTDSEEKERRPVVEDSSSKSSYEDDDDDEEETKPVQDGEIGETGTLVQIQSSLKKMAEPTPPPDQPQPRRKRFIPKYEKVEGTHRVVLGEEEQLQIEMVVGNQVNAQYSWKMVSKKKLLECIDTFGQTTQLFEYKKEIEKYPEPELYMGYIPDESKDVDEFYICCNLEAKSHCKQQSEKFLRRQEKKLEKSLQRKAKPWTCLGSDVELISLIPIPKRPLIEVEIKATYPTLYDPETFDIRDVMSVRDGFIELTPYRQKFNNVYRRRVDNATQVGLPRVARAAQTVLRYPKNMWTQSIADALGSFDPSKSYSMDSKGSDDDESSGDEINVKQPFDEIGFAAYIAAYKRLRRPSYQIMLHKFVSEKMDELISYIELNEVMDIYSNDYPKLVKQKTVDIYDTMTFQDYVCFTDVRAKNKYVSSAVFHPMWAGIVAISYADGSPNIMNYVSTRPDPVQRAVYGLNPVMIWSHIDSLYPKLYLECTREVKVLSFCPFNENLLVGGCVNGQVVVWDLTHKLDKVEDIVVLSETREKYKIAMNAHMGWYKNISDDAVVQSTAMSSLFTSHYGSINTIRWLSPNFSITNTGKDYLVDESESKSLVFFTGSDDGTILIWNLSTENVTFMDNKKVKKSKRVAKRPEGLTTDVSPFKVLDRNLQPSYKLILGKAGRPQTMPIQTLAIDPPELRYIYVPREVKNGRKYFRCEIIKQVEDDMPRVLFCGSQQGEYRKVTWEGHAFNTGELVNSEYADTIDACCIHDGIITCTQRNPFIKHITLTVGGKIFAIWSDKLKSRPLIWKKRSFRMTDGKWSLYKPSILFIATAEGNLETWDLLLRSDQPIVVQTVSGSILTGVSVHTLPLAKNIIGVSDSYGSFKMFIDPPIFMLENPSYLGRMEKMINNELKVMQSYLKWHETWMANNPHIILEMKRKEGLLLAEKEEEKRRLKEEEERRLEEEAEARRLARMKVLGPAERWQRIIQELIERTIAVKKRINRAELIEHEKPLRDLETQRLEKERRMLEIMKNQKTIFNDTVAILFPEAIQKPEKIHKSLFELNRGKKKQEYLQDYEAIKKQAKKTVHDNPYRVVFSWDATFSEGKERRQALNAYDSYIKVHKNRIEDHQREMSYGYIPPKTESIAAEEDKENEEVNEQGG